MKRLIIQQAVLWIILMTAVSWFAGWVFRFAPQLGGWQIFGTTLYLPFRFVFWTLWPQDEWIRSVAYVLCAAFTGVVVYGFVRQAKRLKTPFDEGEMQDADDLKKKGLFE